ncbi:TetR/AcrR family transcriptional regulator C-terminal domain-containing protein [Microlunatus sp. Y2014]|uniref:TetR/AcrR family transcriptional regulator C-terminal domain-containing protein n=1 Tax=Microlunatus sp. Y2014 TaxID=3418488 RepID=UPI003DA75D12
MARPGLTPARVIEAAAAVADAEGLAAVSMRRVGRQLGVEAMSLYGHVRDKEAMLDGLAAWLFAKIEGPEVTDPWRPAMIRRAASQRSVLTKHPWGLGMMESRRNPGPAPLQDHDAVLGCLRRNGFSVALAAQAFSVLDSYVYGFVLTELNLPFEAGDDADAMVDSLDLADRYPYLSELITEQVSGHGYDYGDQFNAGLELIMTELDRRRAAG